MLYIVHHGSVNLLPAGRFTTSNLLPTANLRYLGICLIITLYPFSPKQKARANIYWSPFWIVQCRLDLLAHARAGRNVRRKAFRSATSWQDRKQTIETLRDTAFSHERRQTCSWGCVHMDGTEWNPSNTTPTLTSNHISEMSINCMCWHLLRNHFQCSWSQSRAYPENTGCEAGRTLTELSVHPRTSCTHTHTQTSTHSYYSHLFTPI